MTAAYWAILIPILVALSWAAVFYVAVLLFIKFISWFLNLDDGPGPENRF